LRYEINIKSTTICI